MQCKNAPVFSLLMFELKQVDEYYSKLYLCSRLVDFIIKRKYQCDIL